VTLKNKSILVSGYSGFLLSNLIPFFHNSNSIIFFDSNSNYDLIDIDIIVHFASPSDDFDFSNRKRTAFSMIDDSLFLCNLALSKNAKFIFASSLAVNSISNSYSIYKLAIETYIKDIGLEYIILRIPRVYDKTRKKGLMKKLSLGLVPLSDMNNIISFISLDSFIIQTLFALNSCSFSFIFNYSNLESSSIYSIKDNYC
jgi:nucleoside-diphosphate-sugar epimerase